jgi:hypothetical protein
MEKSEHYDLVVFYCEVCGVRKSPKKTAPESAMNHWIKQRIASNLNGIGIKHPKKFLAKAR